MLLEKKNNIASHLQIDKLDEDIIQFLQKDGRRSYTEIADDLGTTVGTVRNRVQRLIENDILKVVGVVNPFKTGMPTVAMFGIKVQLNKLGHVIERLTEIPEVRFVAASTGTYDIFIEVITTSNSDLYRIIKEEFSKIEGIVSTESSLILEIYKQSYDWGVG
jgi:Lrp/AsnC family transcriptional regulator, regulator for asnA, asnC and gidA